MIQLQTFSKIDPNSSDFTSINSKITTFLLYINNNVNIDFELVNTNIKASYSGNECVLTYGILSKNVANEFKIKNNSSTPINIIVDLFNQGLLVIIS